MSSAPVAQAGVSDPVGNTLTRIGQAGESTMRAGGRTVTRWMRGGSETHRISLNTDPEGTDTDPAQAVAASDPSSSSAPEPMTIVQGHTTGIADVGAPTAELSTDLEPLDVPAILARAR